MTSAGGKVHAEDMTTNEMQALLDRLEAENKRMLEELRIAREEIARYWANKDQKLPTLAANFGS